MPSQPYRSQRALSGQYYIFEDVLSPCEMNFTSDIDICQGFYCFADAIYFANSPTVLWSIKSLALRSTPKIVLTSVTTHIVSNELISRSALKLLSGEMSSTST